MAGWVFLRAKQTWHSKNASSVQLITDLYIVRAYKEEWHHTVSSGLLDKRSSVYQLCGEDLDIIFEKTNALCHIRQLFENRNIEGQPVI